MSDYGDFKSSERELEFRRLNVRDPHLHWSDALAWLLSLAICWALFAGGYGVARYVVHGKEGYATKNIQLAAARAPKH